MSRLGSARRWRVGAKSGAGANNRPLASKRATMRHQQQARVFSAVRQGGRYRVVRTKALVRRPMPIPGEMLKRGWGVLPLRPWRLAGIFTLSADAESLAQSLGPDYTVKYGEHAAGSSKFDFAGASGASSV